MSNMSYCMFQNTRSDLRDCVDELGNAESLEDLELSIEEKSAMNRMYQLAQDFIAEFDRLNVEEEETV